VANEDGKRPFDETAVLEELERLRGAILQARSLREEKVAEFELFARTARMAARVEAARAAGIRLDDVAPQVPPPPADRPVVQPPVREPVIASQVRGGAAEPPATEPLPPFERVSRLDDLAEATARFPEPESSRWPLKKIAFGTGLILLAVLIAWGMRRESEPSFPSTAPAPTGLVSSPQASPPSPGATAGTTEPPQSRRPLQIELTTSRPVWMRVTVDGDRVVERQIEGGQRLQFGADRTIQIRAGDAGAVSLSVDGEPATPMGRDGQIANRTLAPRAR
jgi:hypothetical protein